MRMSQLVGARHKEQPAEALLASHAFLLRGGYLRQVSNGIYSLLHPGVRVVRKIENIVRSEMNRAGGQEVLMPVVLPRELWEESGRYASVGQELARFNDRTGHGMLLAMTHEEAVVHLARNEAASHKQYPFMLYQIQTKFRDEPRSRGGLIRVREFTMKDAYSFHRSQADLEQCYANCALAYARIFARVGLPEVAMVKSDTGMMGGRVAHEFMLLCDAGEDTVICCETCGYTANIEVAEGKTHPFPAAPEALKEVHTPGASSIEEVAAFLGVAPRQTAKAVFYEADAEGRPVLALVRGDIGVNEAKLARILKRKPEPASEAAIRQTGAEPGFASAIGLSGCRIVADFSVRDSNNLVCGANRPDYHCLNFNLERDAPGVETADIALAREGDACPECGGGLAVNRGIEVGNIFQLGTKYSQAMGMRYLDENGKEQVPIMGCYGIGVGRTMSSIVEARRDKFGPLWPVSVAPWPVHVAALKLGNPQIRAAADKLYADLTAAGLEALYDDRNENPGVQFADADLLGAPLRFVASEKRLANGEFEWKTREDGKVGTVSQDGAAAMASEWLAQAENKLNRDADGKTLSAKNGNIKIQ